MNKDFKDILPKSFYNILAKVVENKSYGSIEIYLENGRVTQITERIIRKVRNEDEKSKNHKKTIDNSLV